MILNAVEIKPDVYWVGGIDWDLRNFHGYQTPGGTTYNAYLIKDKKIVLIDTVKHYLFDEMMSRIKDVIDPKKIDVIISNHVEMDHSGSLPKIKEYIPDATVVTSTRGEKGLQKHYTEDLNLKVMKSGESLNIGDRTLEFLHMPMVHWPDSMATYSLHDKLLLPNDAFGQHIASAERFDDDLGWSLVRSEAAKYYANIVLPYGDQVTKVLDAVKDLSIDMIAPSHGVIWRSYLKEIIQEYQQWSTFTPKKKAVIIYDSMWGSTKTLAYALAEGIEKTGMPVTLRNLTTTHVSDIVTDIMESRLICLGSPTLNNGMMPSMGSLLTYVKGLRPRNKLGFLFGSYGWGGQALTEMEKMIEPLQWTFPEEHLNINYIPQQEDLKKIQNIGKSLGNDIKKNNM